MNELQLAVERLHDGARGIIRETLSGPGIPSLDTDTGRYRVRPDYTPNEWKHFQWTGFLTGKLWLLSELTGDAALADGAAEICRRIEPVLSSGPVTNENAGFDIFYTFSIGYNITGDEWYRQAAMRALDHYRTMYRPELGVFLCDADVSEMVIDTSGPLMEFFWARGWDADLGRVLKDHMDRTLELGLVKDDGSTMQGLEFDLHTGDVERYWARQSATGSSHWTRAQGWAMCNYMNGYEATGDPVHLETVLNTARWFVDHTPHDTWVNAYDFDDERDDAPRDTCTSLMAASTFLRLGRTEVADAAEWSARGREILEVVCRDHMTYGGVVLHGSWGNVRASRGIGRFPLEDVMPYGNYWVVEGLYRALRDDWSALTLTPAAERAAAPA
ncbi:hypothetical protein [Microbacterium sp. CPCC 204701]|uniref:hypothetical protein n=1 Tax=Microbacterium sp. CPCC 204701 TaxID=2493084 RepID=UPI000FD8160E|nr:hypothetical protein [Microbacterium sp. CPCC 204701]